MDPGTGVGIATGAIVGLVTGLLARAATSGRVVRRRLEAILRDRAMRILLRGVPSGEGAQAQSVLAQLKELVSSRRSHFAMFVETQFEMAIADIEGKLDAVNEEELALKKKQQEIIASLEPKVEILTALGTNARAICDAYALLPTP
jgi:gas vesicle protein